MQRLRILATAIAAVPTLATAQASPPGSAAPTQSPPAVALLYLSCNVSFSGDSVTIPLVVDFNRHTVNDTPATISDTKIEFTRRPSEADKASWRRRRVNIPDETVEITRKTGAIFIHSDYLGPSSGACVTTDKPKS